MTNLRLRPNCSNGSDQSRSSSSVKHVKKNCVIGVYGVEILSLFEVFTE